MWQTLETTHNFFSGEYDVALSKAGSGQEIAPAIEIACLVFLGRIPQAELVRKRTLLYGEQKAFADYFLGVGYVRESRYSEAKQIFANNSFLFRHSKKPIAKFFAICSIAFFRYFCGRYRSSMRLSNLATALAKEHNFLYGEIISLDLYANSSVSCGEVRKGLQAFRQITKLVQILGGGSFETAVKVSLAVNEAAVSAKPLVAIEKLRSLRRKQVTNTYSSAEINLELIRQYTLLGQASEARKLLEETFDLVHKNNNRRQAATLNLRVAFLRYLDGETIHALHLLRVAKKNLHAEVDLMHLARLSGLEIRVLKQLGKHEEALQVDKELNSKQFSKLQSDVNRRIRLRENKKAIDSRPGEDPLGDAIDQWSISSDESSLEQIFSMGYLTLLRSKLDIAPGERKILFGRTPETTLLIDKAEMKIPTALSRIHREILFSLGRGPKTKAELIFEVWGYEYHPLNHDGLLHSAIRTLRGKIQNNWIELTEDGYQLSEGVIIQGSSKRKISTLIPEAKKAILNTSRDKLEFRSDLNVRQNEILESLLQGKKKSWRPRDVRVGFSISTMTAARDLTELCNKGILLRVGKGRATYYILHQNLAN